MNTGNEVLPRRLPKPLRNADDFCRKTGSLAFFVFCENFFQKVTFRAVGIAEHQKAVGFLTSGDVICLKRFPVALSRAGDCPFFCEKKEAQRSGKGTALVPLQTSTKFRCRKRCGTTALVNSLREFVRGGSVSSHRACLRNFTPWLPVRAVPPTTATELCSLWRVAE